MILGPDGQPIRRERLLSPEDRARLEADLDAWPGERRKSVACMSCEAVISAVSMVGLAEAIVVHEATHGKRIAFDRDTGDMLPVF